MNARIAQESGYVHVDRNVYRFLIAAFSFLIVCVIGLIGVTFQQYTSMVKDSQTTNVRQDKTLAAQQEALRELQQQNVRVIDQLAQQQSALSALTATVQALHEEVAAGREPRR